MSIERRRKEEAERMETSVCEREVCRSTILPSDADLTHSTESSLYGVFFETYVTQAHQFCGMKKFIGSQFGRERFSTAPRPLADLKRFVRERGTTGELFRPTLPS